MTNGIGGTSGIRRRHLFAGTALIALMLASEAQAQDAPVADVAAEDAPQEEDIIVTGVREALKRAEDIKRNSDTIVDSITATDIGAFPDKSIAEALQRVPGVTVTRSAYKDDVMHYSAEPSGVIIRGLSQTRSEFNGRDTFSATSGYGLSWSDISPELMAGVDVYKNQTAEMIEGGIAGTVNLRTRLPFDQTDQLIAGSVTLNYGDISKRGTFDVSGLYSNRWQTGAGEFGLLVNGAHSTVETVSRGATLPRMMPFAAGIYGDREVYIPSGINYSESEHERIRNGISVAGQWESSDGRLTATARYNRSEYDNTWYENALLSYWAYVDPATTNHSTVFTDPNLLGPPDAPGLGFNEAGGGTPFTFADNGLFETGVITGSRGDWGFGLIDWATGTNYVPGSTDQYGVLPNGDPLIEPCLRSDVSHANVPCRAGAPVHAQTRYSSEQRVVEDVAFNFGWQATDRLRFNVDLQHIKATTEKTDVTVNFETRADMALDLTGDYPVLGLLEPSGYNTIGDDIFSDPRNYSPQSVMDHITDSEGTSDAIRLDAVYDFDSEWLDELRVGGRYADRRQEHRWSLYNWASIASDWGVNPADSMFLDSGPTYNEDGTIRFQGYEPDYYEVRSFGEDILGGGLLSPEQLVFMRRDIISNRDALVDRFSIAGQTDQGGVASTTWNAICDRPDEIEGSCFTPGEILDVREETKSAYAMLKFGGNGAQLLGAGVVGNVGVRWVETEVESGGGINFAQPFTASDLNCQPLAPEVIDQLEPGQYAVTPACLAVNSVDDLAFSTGGSIASTVRTTHRNVLPSFNLRLEVGRSTYVRFAASRAISKPDIGYLKNFMSIRRSFLAQSDIREGNPDIVLDDAGEPVSYNFSYSASMSNPRLKPIKADQFDISFEHYFSPVGSVTAVFFYKKFHDYIQNGTFVIPITNNGVTRDVVATGPVNGDGASIKGFELQAQRYFDFLPAPFDGLGVQANYTLVDNEGVTNANLVVDTTGEGAVARSSQSGMINPGRLESMSDHSVNFILMYEKPRFGARLAYNWRSKYLNSVNDCCLGFPVWNEAEGFLDASLRYAVTDNIEFSIQGSNLLNTRTRMLAQVKGPTDLDPDQAPAFLPGGWFEYDRRVQFGLRAKF